MVIRVLYSGKRLESLGALQGKKRFSRESNFKVLSFRVKEGFGVEDFLLALNYFKVLAPCMHVKDP
jgi:hypothetical protein